MIFTKNAARPGSEGGKGIDQYEYNNTTAPAAQPHCTPMPNQGAITEKRVGQLRLLPIDGVWEEPYTPPACAGNGAATSAAVGEGMTQ